MHHRTPVRRFGQSHSSPRTSAYVGARPPFSCNHNQHHQNTTKPKMANRTRLADGCRAEAGRPRALLGRTVAASAFAAAVAMSSARPLRIHAAGSGRPIIEALVPVISRPKCGGRVRIRVIGPFCERVSHSA